MAKIKSRRRDNFSKELIKQQRADIESKILEIGKKTQRFIRESQEKNSRRPTIDGDVADAANDFQSEAVRISMASKDARMLQQLVDAKMAILKGTYGFCIQCSKKISEKRLKVVPWANCCKPCQEAFEKGWKG